MCAQRMNGNELAVRFITTLTWNKIPEAAQRKARMALLDVLGATMAGTLTAIADITAGFAADVWPGTEATILWRGRRASAIGAAFANGYAANGIDIDDCGWYTKGHPGVQVFPTSLALCEAHNLSGADLLTGMVIGYEIAHRAARIWHATHEIYQACGSWGSVACAAIAGHLLRLRPEQVHHALGIAEYHAPNLPMMRDIDHPTMVKHGIGWGTMTGITAAMLARRGFTGIPSLFGFDEYYDWVADLGENYIMVDGVGFKIYASCAWSHPPINVTKRLMEEHHITVDNIARIKIIGPHETVRLGNKLPTTTEEAQFNTAWPLAVYLLDGELGPRQILEYRLQDPKVRELASRIELEESPELSELHNRGMAGDPKGGFFAIAEITLKDGRVLRSVPADAGVKYAGWTEEEVERKFRWLLKDIVEPERIDRLVDLVWHFDKASDVHELVRLATIHQVPAWLHA